MAGPQKHAKRMGLEELLDQDAGNPGRKPSHR